MYKAFDIFALPYLFKNQKVAWSVLDGPFGKEFADGMLKETGIRLMAYADNGIRHFTNSKKAITKPDDLKGMKMRVQPSPVFIELVKSLGASPSAIDWAELPAALTQGTVDGQENGVTNILAASLYQSQKHVTLDGHVYSLHAYLVSDNFYQSLTADQKKAFDEGVAIAKDIHRKLTAEQDMNAGKILSEKGMTVTELTPDQVEAFRKVAQPAGARPPREGGRQGDRRQADRCDGPGREEACEARSRSAFRIRAVRISERYLRSEVLMIRVTIIDDGYDHYDVEREVLARVGAEPMLRPCRGDARAVVDAIRDADAVLVRESPVTAAAIAAAPRLKGIVRYGIGVDNIDRDAATARRIYIANVPDYGTEDVSDHAMALLLAVARRVPSRDAYVRGGGWYSGSREKMHRLAGKTLGLIGYGRIAQAFERKMRGFGIARVLAFDPYAESAA